MFLNGNSAGKGSFPRICDKESVEFLIDCLEHPDARTRMAAVDALSRSGDKRARLPLKAVLADRWGQNIEVRLAALRCLSEVLGGSDAAALLENFVQGDSARIMAAARKLLKQRDPRRYTARLASRKCLDPWSINAYGREQEKFAVPLLADFLTECISAERLTAARSWGRVFMAIKALGLIGEARAGEALVRTREVLAKPEKDSLQEKRREKLLGVLENSLIRLKIK